MCNLLTAVTERMWYKMRCHTFKMGTYMITKLNKIPQYFRVKNSGALHRTFNVEPLYLQHENSGIFATITAYTYLLLLIVSSLQGLAIDYMVGVIIQTELKQFHISHLLNSINFCFSTGRYH